MGAQKQARQNLGQDSRRVGEHFRSHQPMIQTLIPKRQSYYTTTNNNNNKTAPKTQQPLNEH